MHEFLYWLEFKCLVLKHTQQEKQQTRPPPNKARIDVKQTNIFIITIIIIIIIIIITICCFLWPMEAQSWNIT